MRRDIKRIVSYYVKKFQTTDPFEIADRLSILYQIGEIGCEGCYMFLKNHRYIFLNQNLSEQETKMVMSHELGHAVLHRKENCYFIRNKTLLLNSKIEIEANKFAAFLLLPDDVVKEYTNLGFTVNQISRITGYDEKIIKLRLSYH